MQQNYVQNDSALPNVFWYMTGVNKPQGPTFIPKYISSGNQGYDNYYGYPRGNFNGNNSFSNQNFIPHNNGE